MAMGAYLSCGFLKSRFQGVSSYAAVKRLPISGYTPSFAHQLNISSHVDLMLFACEWHPAHMLGSSTMMLSLRIVNIETTIVVHIFSGLMLLSTFRVVHYAFLPSLKPPLPRSPSFSPTGQNT